MFASRRRPTSGRTETPRSAGSSSSSVKVVGANTSVVKSNKARHGPAITPADHTNQGSSSSSRRWRTTIRTLRPASVHCGPPSRPSPPPTRSAWKYKHATHARPTGTVNSSSRIVPVRHKPVCIQHLQYSRTSPDPITLHLLPIIPQIVRCMGCLLWGFEVGGTSHNVPASPCPSLACPC